MTGIKIVFAQIGQYFNDFASHEIWTDERNKIQVSMQKEGCKMKFASFLLRFLNCLVDPLYCFNMHGFVIKTE